MKPYQTFVFGILLGNFLRKTVHVYLCLAVLFFYVVCPLSWFLPYPRVVKTVFFGMNILVATSTYNAKTETHHSAIYRSNEGNEETTNFELRNRSYRANYHTYNIPTLGRGPPGTISWPGRSILPFC